MDRIALSDFHFRQPVSAIDSGVTSKTFQIDNWQHPRSPRPFEHQHFPYRFDSSLQVEVDFESFLDPAANQISGRYVKCLDVSLVVTPRRR